jgi:hypothetical protein
MRHAEIAAPASHPYIACITIDPVDMHSIERRCDDMDEVRILRRNTSTPDLWTIHIGCASQAVADRVEECWG